MVVLEFNNVTKTYNANSGAKKMPLTAVKNVSFEVNGGEVVGFIGPNGAGKSTAIKMITGLATPSSGEISIMGYDIVKNRVAAIKNVGAIIENPDMYVDWTAFENLKYFASLTPKSEEDTLHSAKEIMQQRISDMLSMVGLFERRNDKVKKFSLGMKQRLGIAQALLNKPKLLILDEPANGLDPMGIKDMRDIVTHLAHDLGLAVLISSHQLAEMQLMCDRFLIINKGEIIATPTAMDLKSAKSQGIIITTDNVEKAIEIIKEKFGVEAVAIDKERLQVSGDIASGDIAKELILSNLSVKGIENKKTSLEEFFMAKTNSKEVINVK